MQNAKEEGIDLIFDPYPLLNYTVHWSVYLRVL